jgi:hypothetical protein
VVDNIIWDPCIRRLRGHSVQAKRAADESGWPSDERRWQRLLLPLRLSLTMHPPTTTLFWARLLTMTVAPTFLRAGSLLEVRRAPYLQQPTYTRTKWSWPPPWRCARTSPRVATGRTRALHIATEAGRRWGEILRGSKGVNCARSRPERVCALLPVAGSFRGGPAPFVPRSGGEPEGKGSLQASGATGR